VCGAVVGAAFPHLITISHQASEDTHWIAQEYPPTNRDPQRKYIALSVYDARNLDAGVIPALERLYPPSHPAPRSCG